MQFKNKILALTKPHTNNYLDNRDKYSKQFNLITEDKSSFESILKEMNNSQNIISRVKIIKCENPNCKSAFSKYEKCNSCGKFYCDNCLNLCDNCNMKCCKFCYKIDYSKFQDIMICANCV